MHRSEILVFVKIFVVLIAAYTILRAYVKLPKPQVLPYILSKHKSLRARASLRMSPECANSGGLRADIGNTITYWL